MALNEVARRIHAVSPRPVRLELDDGTAGVFRLNGTEFFQDEFNGEGSREGDDATYRFVTSEDSESRAGWYIGTSSANPISKPASWTR